MEMATTTKLQGAVAGLVSGGLALAVGELVAGIGGSRRSPVIAVGDLVIDVVPRPVKDLAVDWFGTNDKTALLVGIYAILAVAAALLGVRALRRFSSGAIGIGAFGAIGVLAATQEVGVSFAELLASVIGALVGIGVLWLLVGAVDGSAVSSVETPVLERRAFLKLGGAAALVGTGAASIGTALQRRVSAVSSRLGVVLPIAARKAPAVPAGADLRIDGLSPFTTPNRSFYRIDVNLLVPQVAAEAWSLTVKGRVAREVKLTYDELLRMPMEEHDVTLTCVSNEIGGRLVGNARWLGTPLVPILERAGIDAGADQVVARSVDGWTAGLPLSPLRDGRVALLAVGMNGEPLPLAHGFPARLVVAGLYGYVSATKWVKELEVTRFDDYDAYWVQRGWSREAPIKVMSRIDTPRGGVDAGTLPVAGVAWAQHIGIAKVEVRVDDGPWNEADLGEVLTADTWRQWKYDWDATPGRHSLTVRATDAHGTVQPEERVDPFPDGATGWHSVTVGVRG